jgi:hypothetical protein
MANQICEDIRNFIGVIAECMGETPNKIGMIPNLSLAIRPETLDAAIAVFDKRFRNRHGNCLALEFFRGERRALFQGYGYQLGRIFDGWAAALSRHTDNGMFPGLHGEAVIFLLGAIEQTRQLNLVNASDDDAGLQCEVH